MVILQIFWVMYGGAIDNVSAGGPYMWVFRQTDIPSDVMISQLQMPTGTPTDVARNAINDFLDLTDSLAGGMFIADSWSPAGQRILGGIVQNGPDRLFGYDLDFVPGPVIDAGIIGITELPVPSCSMGANEFITIELINMGAEPLTDFDVELEINGTLTAEIYLGTLVVGATGTHTFADLDFSVAGLYFVTISSAAAGDIDNSNDTQTALIASREVSTPPVNDDFNTNVIGDVAFNGLYNIGTVLFEANKGETPSANTGSIDDVGGGGTYIYMEASPWDVDDQAILATDCLDFSNVESVELYFSYHMFGDGSDISY